MNATRTLSAVALLVGLTFGGAALAQTTNTAVSGAQGTASNEGNNQAITVNGDTVHGSDIPNNTPNISAPALTTTLTETCMGSSSFGAAVAGFGVTAGTTWRDEECVRRLNARELRAMGLGLVAKELMCDNDDIRAAFERAGRQAPDLPQCQRTVDERTILAGDALPEGTKPYTITTRTADPFNNATRHDDEGARDANGGETVESDPWAHTTPGDDGR